MIFRVCIHVPDIAPDSPEAGTAANTIEDHLGKRLDSLTERLNNPFVYWWWEIQGGESCYSPGEISETFLTPPQTESRITP